MKRIKVLMLTLMMTAALAACGSSGSSGNGLSGSVSTNGSTSMEKVVLILGEQFMLDHEDVKISYDPTGSGTGIEAARTGTADIGLSSRALKDGEKEQGLVETVVALDGIAIIVNEENPVENLTLEQLAALYTGSADWSSVGGSGAVAAVGRESGSGTRDGFESITDTEGVCKLSQELTSTGAVLEAVRSNPQAIGYAALSAVEGKEGIRAITVDGVACTEETVLDGTYPIQRPFVFVTREGETLSETAQTFFDWAISADAAELIRAAGAVPVAK